MLETFTPAVCGSRRRQMLAQAVFATAAVAAAAALGLVLGLAGDVLGAERAVLAAAALALAAAVREAGILRLPLPQMRRQVPERWRFELPLPVWAGGYGAGLGLGVVTHQAVSTFWVACAAALALARPLPAALCLAFFGAGRALMVVVPRRRASDPTEAVERLVRRRPALLRANALALVACAILLASAPGADAGRVARQAIDPSSSGRTFAFARQTGEVVVRRPSRPDVVYGDASQPALSGRYLAYVDARGIRIVRWRSRTEVARLGGTRVSQPALAWPNIAYVLRADGRKQLIVRNLVTRKRWKVASVRSSVDLGRPSLRHGRVAWHVVSRTRSRIWVGSLESKRKRTVAATRIGRLSSPALYRKRLVWVDERSGRTYLRQGSLTSKRRRAVARVRTRWASYWTTSLSQREYYVTRWSVSSRAADIYRGRP